MNKGSFKPIWTKHAIERVEESPIKFEFVEKFFKTTTMATLRKHVEEWKFKRYGMKQFQTAYYIKTIQLIYTINKETGEVITFTVKDPQTKEIWGKEF